MIVFRDLLYRKSHSLLSFFSPQRISIGNWYQLPMLILSALCEAKQLTN